MGKSLEQEVIALAASIESEVLSAIVRSYEPYCTHEAFGEGLVAYQHGRYGNPHEGVAAQAWDRGLEAGMRYARVMR